MNSLRLGLGSCLFPIIFDLSFRFALLIACSPSLLAFRYVAVAGSAWPSCSCLHFQIMKGSTHLKWFGTPWPQSLSLHHIPSRTLADLHLHARSLPNRSNLDTTGGSAPSSRTSPNMHPPLRHFLFAFVLTFIFTSVTHLNQLQPRSKIL